MPKTSIDQCTVHIAKSNLLCNQSSRLWSLASPTCHLFLGIGLQDLTYKEGKYGGLIWDDLRASKLVKSWSKAFTNSPHLPSLNFYTIAFGSRRAWNSLTMVLPFWRPINGIVKRFSEWMIFEIARNKAQDKFNFTPVDSDDWNLLISKIIDQWGHLFDTNLELLFPGNGLVFTSVEKLTRHFLLGAWPNLPLMHASTPSHPTPYRRML